MSGPPLRASIAGTPDNATAAAAFGALFDFVMQRLAAGTAGAGTATDPELAAARATLVAAMSGENNDLTAIPIGTQGAYKRFAADAVGVNNYGCVITADSVILKNATHQYRSVRSVNLTVAANGTVGDPLSIMSVRAASTWYYRWLWYNATLGLTATLDISSTAPTAPTGYVSTDYCALLPGACLTDGSGSTYLMQIKTRGNYSWYVPRAGSNVTSFRTLASGAAAAPATPTWSAVAVGAYVPTPTAGTIHVKLGISTFAQYASAASNANFPTSFGTLATSPLLSCQGGSSAVWSSMSDELPLETTNIYYNSSDATGYLVCVGWRDNV